MSDILNRKLTFAKFDFRSGSTDGPYFLDSFEALIASFPDDRLTTYVLTEFAKTAAPGRMLIESSFLVVCQSAELPFVETCPYCGWSLSFGELDADQDEVTQDVECKSCGFEFRDFFQLHRRDIRRKSNRSE